MFSHVFFSQTSAQDSKTPRLQDSKAPDKMGNTALHLSAKGGFNEFVRAQDVKQFMVIFTGETCEYARIYVYIYIYI